MKDIITWILLIQTIGIIFFPVCHALFNKLPDKGYSISKILSLIFLTYLAWLINSIQWIGFSQISLISLLIILVITQLLFINKLHFRKSWDWIKSNLYFICIVEMIFSASFLLCCFFISQNPNIQFTEQPMDFMILNSLLTSQHFPPTDLWFSNSNLNYYYFGHLLIATISKIATTPASISYNLGLSLICGIVTIGFYGLTYNALQLAKTSVVKCRIYSLLAPVILLGLGNQVGLLELLRSLHLYTPIMYNWIGIPSLSIISSSPSRLLPTIDGWWWNATRVINTIDINGKSLDYTITEFPLFSLVIRDLHSHLLSLPIIVIGLFLSLQILQNTPFKAKYLNRFNILALIFTSIVISVSFMTNPWNFPVLLISLFGAYFLSYSLSNPDTVLRNIISSIVSISILIVLSMILTLPFFLHYQSNHNTIGLVTTINTRYAHMFLINGLWIMISLPFIIFHIFLIQKHNIKKLEVQQLFILLLCLIPYLIWIIAILISNEIVNPWTVIVNKSYLTLPLSTIGGLTLYIIVKQTSCQRPNYLLLFTLSLFFISYMTLAATELFYIKDIFGNRMNTMFKFYYQVWIYLGIGSSLVVFSLLLILEKTNISKRSILLVCSLCMLTLGIIGPAYYSLALLGTHEFISLKDMNIDGTSFISYENPTEMAAITWLTQQKPANIVETYGTDYSSAGRISSLSGNSTILAWPGHQIQWRANQSEILRLTMEINTIYESTDYALTHALIKKHAIKYIYIGNRELKSHALIKLSKFNDLYSLAYSNNGISIYDTEIYYDSSQ